MKIKILLLSYFSFLISSVSAQQAVSPDGRLSLEMKDSGYVLGYRGQTVLEIPYIGYGEKSVALKAKPKAVASDYRMLTGKRLHCVNQANEYKVTLSKGVTMIVRLYNDGLAFRYQMAKATGKQEQTTFRIPQGRRRWMQQWCDSYEGFFPMDTTYKVAPVPSYSGTFRSKEGWNNRWGFPALLEASPNPSEGGESAFALITEANIEKGQSASCLYNDGELFRVTPSPLIPQPSSLSHQPSSILSPWRVVIVGTLKDVVESTLVTDVSDPCKVEDVSWIQPGVVSWIYWAYNHGSNDYDIIRKYVDMAEAMHWPYVLIDAEWDEMKKGKTIEDALAYAHAKGIKPLIWYNSSIGWVNGAPGPKYRLNKPEDREKEFAWCEKMGVAGVKIDFFSGDNQQNMDYCIDLLESAARHHLLVNFHGATIPRGWQRTWPNLMSTEGVYGAEWYNNVATFTEKAARHNATLPFTRNVIGPMDYTPCTFSDSQHPHITTHAHELALTVLFESGLQHMADRPESYLAQPAMIRDFLSNLPTAWDETRFVSGYPGESVVMARRYGTTWYVAGINGTDSRQTLQTPVGFIPRGQVLFYSDDEIYEGNKLPTTVSCRPRGGFVMVVRQSPNALPLVYDVEQTVERWPFNKMPAAKELPVQHGLPDALKGVSNFGDWARRRSEIAAQIQHYGIGEKPAVSKENVKARMNGDTLIVDVTVNGQTLTLRADIQYPKTGTAPYALMIGTSGIALPRTLFDNRPIARMIFREKQVNDYGQFGKHHERGEHNFDRLYPHLKDNGAYSEWAWGLSRLIDGLQQLGPAVTKIDTRHIGVTGCSYAGKMALYCGAFDERVALVIAQEPGGGGAASWRKSHELTLTGKNLEDLDKTDYHWFQESQKENFHGDSVYQLPYDQHELCALVFPRALLLLGNPDYEWLADESMLVSAKAARDVWRRFGVEDRMGWSIVNGHGHCQLPASQYAEVQAFIDKFLLGREADTRDVRIVNIKSKNENTRRR